jgi:signal transduction histidine kinase
MDIPQKPTINTGFTSCTLDLATVTKLSQALAEEIVLDQLLNTLLKIVMDNTGAQTSYLLLDKDGQMRIQATSTVEQGVIVLRQENFLEDSQQVPASLIDYVAKTKRSFVLNNATDEGLFTTDPYVIREQPKSILCSPILNQGQLMGLLYLENKVRVNTFTPECIELVKFLSAQVAISLKNAWLYENLEITSENLIQTNSQLENYSLNLEQKVAERTLELEEKNVRLQHTLEEVKRTQSQLVQTEKISGLGQLVAGVAHEISNPVNFIHGNFTYAKKYLQDLLRLIQLYQEHYPEPTPEIQIQKERIELDFLIADFSKLLDSMQLGSDRIRQIVSSLQNFSRIDEAEMKPVDIHEGIENTLLILQHRIREKIGFSGLQVIKNYGDLPLVECYPGQLNQVFMNIITNALDSLEMSDRYRSVEDLQERPSRIEIITEMLAPSNTELNPENYVLIRIADNGLGMTEEVHHKIFDPFFTTKPVGSGTGLGLSIAYQIVVEKHRGKLQCISAPGQGAEFRIEIPIKQRKKY